MTDEQKAKLRLPIALALCVDVVGCSKLLTDEQSQALQGFLWREPPRKDLRFEKLCQKK
jgi:hypothetical protein